MLGRFLVIPLAVLLLSVACNSKPVIPTTSPLSPLASPLLTATSQPTAMPTLKVVQSPTPQPALTATVATAPAPTPVGIAPPSGLIYKTQDGLWRVNSDGKSVRLLTLSTDHMSFVLSPEGDRALHWDWNEGDIWLGDLHTGEMQNLTNSPTRFECCPLWWPERPEMILFASQSSNDRPWGPTLLVAKNLSSGELQIIDQSGSFLGPAAFSADGTSLAYSKNGQPVVCRADKGCASFNLADFGVPTTTARGAGGPAWSSDGKSIAMINVNTWQSQPLALPPDAEVVAWIDPASE